MKVTTTFIWIITLTFWGCQQKQTITIEWTSSDARQQWETQSVTVEPKGSIDENAITIYPEEERQQVDGFGGCFNELGWEALSILEKAEQEEVMTSLFGQEGCRFNICRMPIGASDFAVDWYSHNETQGDFQMENFSIDRDKKRLIPYIKAAQALQPNLQVWGSPWSPPAWMKRNDHYACLPGEANDLPEEGRGKEKDFLPLETQFQMEKEYLDAYALYFSRFLSAYEEEGIDLYAVHVQNEPNSCQVFPSCLWMPKDLATFIGDHLGPELSKKHPNTELWLGTIERPQISRIDTTVLDEKARQYIKGIGFQWAGKGAIPDVHKKYPAYRLMQTETECGDGSNDWEAAAYTFDLMKHYFNNGVNSYMYWNMILNETGKSQWGWKQNSMITVDTESKKATYNPEFYLMKHFSHYIQPGAMNVASSDPNALAFKSANELVIVYYNPEAQTMKRFIVGNETFEVELAGQSFNTFVMPI